MSKPVVPRERAREDVEEILDYYLAEDSLRAAEVFVEALEQAYAHLGRYPASGSPRYAHELGLPNLRCWALRGYPYLVLYVERDEVIDVWRVLHGERDIPSWMRDPDS